MAVRFSVSGSRKGLRKRGSDSYQVSLLNTALHLRSISRHPCKVSFTGEKYTEEEYDMSSREESSTKENVQKDIQCLRKVFS